MQQRFEEGDILTMHFSYKGKRYTRVRARANEAGITGVATRYRVQLKIGEARIPGNQIYGVEKAATLAASTTLSHGKDPKDH